MFTKISKTGSGRYIFFVGDDPKDDSQTWISSFADSAVLGDIPATFSSYGECHAFALRVAEERPSCVLAKKAAFYALADGENSRMIAETSTLSHYNEQVEIIGQRINLLCHTKPDDFAAELEASKKEVEGIKGEIEKLIPIAESEDTKKSFSKLLKYLESCSLTIDKLEPKAKTASVSTKASFLPKEAIRAFSEAAMLAIRPVHDEIFVRTASFFPETSTYESILSTPNGDVLKLSFDRNFLLSGIAPCGEALEKCGGTHTNSFLVNYWEPIVHSVGHFYSKGHEVVAVTGMESLKRGKIKAFSMNDNSESYLTVDRPVVLGNRTWILGKTAVKVTTPPTSSIIIDDEVECVDQNLPTYFGRTGSVNEVANKPGRLMYRVDFRRGVGNVWLEDKSIKKVELGV
jgi:hypothetical protein